MMPADLVQEPLVWLVSRGDDEKRARTLVEIACEALAISPPRYVRSILGPAGGWIPPYGAYDEMTMLDPSRPLRALKYLLDSSVPSLPCNPPPFGPPALDRLFFHPTLVLRRPDHNGSWTTFRDEAWFFINGVMTNDDVARLNAAYLSFLFHRPLTIIQNSTNSLPIDLLQCAIGKQWDVITEPVTKAFPPIHAALKDPAKTRVVIIAHSQGTIIAADVLDWLKYLAGKGTKGAKRSCRKPAPISRRRLHVAAAPPAPYGTPAEPVSTDSDTGDPDTLDADDFETLTVGELAKLEIYGFANCASQMTHFAKGIPWIESFGNELDIVARLGMFATSPDVRIDGPRWESRGTWGHLLNAHYLKPIEAAQKTRRRKEATRSAPYVPYGEPSRVSPALYDYLDGGVRVAPRRSPTAPG